VQAEVSQRHLSVGQSAIEIVVKGSSDAAYICQSEMCINDGPMG